MGRREGNPERIQRLYDFVYKLSRVLAESVYPDVSNVSSNYWDKYSLSPVIRSPLSTLKAYIEQDTRIQ